jgi:crossover junction endodeoxyribonuclease RuvC
VRVFGIDPGSQRTGYGCIDTDGSRHRLVDCGAVTTPPGAAFPEKLLAIHQALVRLLRQYHPDCVAVESVFHATNVRSALKLGHARGVALLAAVEGGYPLAEYTPAEVKQTVVGYGRAEKHQVGEMVRRLLGLAETPEPHDASDALAVAICHIHSAGNAASVAAAAGVSGAPGSPARPADRAAVRTPAAAGRRPRRVPKSWREYRP